MESFRIPVETVYRIRTVNKARRMTPVAQYRENNENKTCLRIYRNTVGRSHAAAALHLPRQSQTSSPSLRHQRESL